MKKPKKLKVPKPINLLARELYSNPLYRKKVEPSEEESAAKRDSWNRKAKHKNEDVPDG